MGLFDFLNSENLGNMINQAINQTLNQAQIQNDVIDDMTKKSEELKARPKPGKVCMGTCGINDERCQECLQAQQPIAEGLAQLQQIERAIANPQLVQGKKFTKCTLCGAPYESSEQECPYCGTAYPEDIITIDLPQSVDELKRLARKTAGEAWSHYPALRQKQQEQNKEVMLEMLAPLRKLPGGSAYIKSFTQGMNSSLFRPLITRAMTMTPDQLQQGADKYGVTLSEYMYGVIHDEMESVSQTELSAQMQAQQEQQRRASELRMQQMQQQQQSDSERYQRQLNMVLGTTPKYGGGGRYIETCCDCTYYSAGAGKCGRTGFKTNAGDSCGYFRIK